MAVEDDLADRLKALVTDTVVNGETSVRAPHILNVSVAGAVKVSVWPWWTNRLPIGPSTGAVLPPGQVLASWGVGVVKNWMLGAPSGQRPWLTSLVCGPNVMASTWTPSAANSPIASPVLFKLKLTWRSSRLLLFKPDALSAQTRR